MSAKMSPSAVLVIQNGVTRLVNVKNQDAITKVIDMAPDFINKFLGGKPPVSEETAQAAQDAAAAYDTGTAEHIDEIMRQIRHKRRRMEKPSPALFMLDG